MTQAEIGPERGDEAAAIAAIHEAAFGGGHEAAVVAGLRASDVLAASLVARRDGVPVGHVMFSAVAAVIDGAAIDAVALAPLAVRPDAQGVGLGRALVRAGLAEMAGQGRDAVFVRGSPHWYAAFDFRAAHVAHLAAPWGGPNWMGLALRPGALDGAAGTVGYPAAFFPGRA